MDESVSETTCDAAPMKVARAARAAKEVDAQQKQSMACLCMRLLVLAAPLELVPCSSSALPEFGSFSLMETRHLIGRGNGVAGFLQDLHL